MSYSRYAIYYLTTDDALADFGASWLGWDVRSGREVAQFDLPGLRDITMTPRKYGFHATLKPPFRLAEGASVDQLSTAAMNLATALSPAACGGLRVTRLGHFLALTPSGDGQKLRPIADRCVTRLDDLRAPSTDAEIDRRRAVGLTPRQDGLLKRWGYPYVMEDFRFHMTLTGRLPDATARDWQRRMEDHLPPLPPRFSLDRITLCGERSDGNFEVLEHYALTG